LCRLIVSLDIAGLGGSPHSTIGFLNEALKLLDVAKHGGFHLLQESEGWAGRALFQIPDGLKGAQMSAESRKHNVPR